MSSFENVNGVLLAHLLPLKNWRVMSIDSLREHANFTGHEARFRKIIIQFEKKHVLSSVIDPFTSKKYVWLTKAGESLLGVDDRLPELTMQNILHQSKVVELCQFFQNFPTIKNIELANQRVPTQSKISSDAFLIGNKKNIPFKVAFELELSRQSRERTLIALANYLDSPQCDYVLYYFHNRGLFDFYQNKIKEDFGLPAFSKIMLATNEKLMTKKFRFSETKIYFQNKEMEIGKIFEA